MPGDPDTPNWESNLEWKAKNAQTNLSFNVWNVNGITIPETTITALWYRSYVYVIVEKLTKRPLPKKYKWNSSSPWWYPPLAIYSDASTNPPSIAVIGTLISDFALYESVRISNWPCTANAVSIAIYHVV